MVDISLVNASLLFYEKFVITCSTALLQRVLPVEDTADLDLKKLNDMILKVTKHLTYFFLQISF